MFDVSPSCMIKVANLTASISRKGGGLFDAVQRLAQSHDRRQFDERVFGLRDEFTDADLAKWAPVPATAFAATGFKPLGYSPEFAPALENFAPDICHTHGLWVYPSVAVKNYNRKSARPYLVSPHGMLDPWALQNSRWKKRLAWTLFEQAHLRGAKCLRALCASEADSIRKLNLGNPIVVIPNGIDLPQRSADILPAEHTLPENLVGSAGGTPAARWRQAPPWQHLIQPGQKVLLFLSRIHPKKGLVNLLKAWAACHSSPATRHAEWVLAIAGWDQGGHEAELKQLCAGLQIPFTDLRESQPSSTLHPPSSVLFLGPQFNEAKLACYAHCDAFVLPSFSEGLPMVVLEAWANAKPVLITPECNLPEGFQAEAAVNIAATEAGVTAGLTELLRMTETERAAVGNRGRALVEARFTWSRVAAQTEEVYQWMLGGGAKPGSLMG
jgi:poly(glycerol-phosphate) alpha-glucosyltransferase